MAFVRRPAWAAAQYFWGVEGKKQEERADCASLQLHGRQPKAEMC